MLRCEFETQQCQCFERSHVVKVQAWMTAPSRSSLGGLIKCNIWLSSDNKVVKLVLVSIIQKINEKMMCYCKFHGFTQLLIILGKPFVNGIKSTSKITSRIFILTVSSIWVQYFINNLFYHHRTNDQFSLN